MIPQVKGQLLHSLDCRKCSSVNNISVFCKGHRTYLVGQQEQSAPIHREKDGGPCEQTSPIFASAADTEQTLNRAVSLTSGLCLLPEASRWSCTGEKNELGVGVGGRVE